MAALGPVAMPPHLGVAVSGGADSTALALLARDWVRVRGGRLRAFVVDHGLRPESAAEAETVRRRLGALGIPVEVLRWTGPKPASRIQERAREARYVLLFAACRRHGIRELLLGHRLEEQAETVAMRLARGSGPLGLAGMPAVAVRAGVRLLRPLLGFPRARLEALLRAHGVPWVEDPANTDPRFARARLRRQGIDVAGLMALSEEARRARAEVEAALAELAARAVRLDARFGFARVDGTVLAEAPPALRTLLWGRLLAVVGGGRRPPRARVVAGLLARIGAGALPATAGRCLVTADGHLLTVVRETRALPPPVTLVPGVPVLWDGRFLLDHPGPGPRTVAPLALHAEALRREAARHPHVPRAALAALPAGMPTGTPVWPGATGAPAAVFAPAVRLACPGFHRYIVSAPAAPK